MELWKAQLQVKEYVIHVAEATDHLYTNLRFSLLGSRWLPRPVGACLWSLLHIILVLSFSIMLLALLPVLLVLHVSVDVFRLIVGVGAVLCYPFTVLAFILGFITAMILAIVISFIINGIYFVLTCCCWPSAPMPCVLHGRPGEPVAQEGAARPKFPGPLDLIREFNASPKQTMELYKILTRVSFPHWRVRLVSLCREIVPSYDAI
jgi:hypothetical protein